MSDIPKHVITIDFETYYDTDYSLTKMPMQQYIYDARFEVIGVGAQLDAEAPVWITDLYNTSDYLADLPWGDAVCVAHNAMFDAAILDHWFGIRAKRYCCTMMGSRPMLAHRLKSMSLASISNYLGIGKKGTEVVKAKGKNLSDFTPEELSAYGEYCKTDVRLSYIIYNVMLAWYEANNVNVA